MKISMGVRLIVVLSFSLMTHGYCQGVKVPDLFDNGPNPVEKIKLEANEIASLLLQESVIDVSSAAIMTGGCQSVEGNYTVEVSADGAINKPGTNFVKIGSAENPEPIVLNATIDDFRDFFGQTFAITQAKKNKLNDTLISEYSSALSVDHGFTLLSMAGSANVAGQNHGNIPYRSVLIKNFYEEHLPGNSGSYVQGWGAHSLSKSGYPANKAWVRVKALRSNGQIKHAVFLSEWLTGVSACRIVINSTALSEKCNTEECRKNLVFKGTMAITKPSLYGKESKDFAF